MNFLKLTIQDVPQANAEVIINGDQVFLVESRDSGCMINLGGVPTQYFETHVTEDFASVVRLIPQLITLTYSGVPMKMAIPKSSINHIGASYQGTLVFVTENTNPYNVAETPDQIYAVLST